MSEASQTEVHYSVDADQIATICFDLPGRSMNVLTKTSMLEFHAHIEQALKDDNVKGILITSGKKDFMGGVDLAMLGSLCDPFSRTPKEERAKEGYELILGFHKLLRAYETGGKPVACAITGTCMGGGFEIALACHYRVAAKKEKAQIGLPECKVGLMPGFGGTQRLPRLVGVMAASEALLQGKSYTPEKAKAAGFIHDAVDEKKLIEHAKKWLKNADPKKDALQSWDQKGYKIPGGGPYTSSGYQLFVGGNAMTLDKTKGLYLAQEHILSAVYEGLQVPFEDAMRIEVRHFTYLMTNPQSFNMIRTLFLSKQALEKGARRPSQEDVPVNKLKKIGVIGAGMMGSGIAFVAAKAGIKTYLIDKDQSAAERGKETIQSMVTKLVQKRRMSEKDAALMMARILPKTDYTVLKGSDLVIEAVFEDMKVKADILKNIEEAAGSKCIIASNTSTLPITELGEHITYKKNFIGIHFFSPVDKMPLVEIIKGKKTGDRAVARALDFVKKIRKTPIVVNDARFFYANRCIIPYIEEAHRMVTEGISPALIENAAEMLGLPLGPLQLNDEVSLDLSASIQKATAAALGDKYEPSPAADLITKMLQKKRHGKKSGAGFYDYDGREKSLWTGLEKLYPITEEQPSLEEVQTRLMTIQTIEAIRALEQKIITDIRDADVGAIFGWGYPPYTGGPMSYVDMVGSTLFLRQCEKLAKTYGKRFAPPKLLREMGRGGERFYVRFAPEL
ncbi:MAG: 3-hydroxyacyl-CoA dehydrogenase NAD-binding domain-containing protein [Pseudomonadota bacterium]